ncbi:MAG: hypothetical protein U5J98_07995 [Halobacteriales archaeon]|nr:hypothetical protein [Halobacteriales archaeon]
MAEDPDDGRSEGGESAPLGDLAERIRARRAGEEIPMGELEEGADELDDLFEAENYDESAAEGLWDALEEEPELTGGVEAGETPDEHVVPKRSYCEDCEYLSDPPAVHCTHAGTKIIEYVDLDHVRVRNCPIVAQRQALGDRDEGGMTQMSFGSKGDD